MQTQPEPDLSEIDGQHPLAALLPLPLAAFTGNRKDVENLRAFLASSTGVRFLRVINGRTPLSTDQESDQELSAAYAETQGAQVLLGRQLGWSSLFRLITLRMTTHAPKSQQRHRGLSRVIPPESD